MGREIDLVVADMAGTTIAIADEMPEAFAEAFAACEIPISLSEVKRVRGMAKREAIAHLLLSLSGRRDIDANLVYEHFEQCLATRLRSSDVQGVPQAVETLQWFRAQGVPVFLATGFSRKIAAGLMQRLGWSRGVVDGIVTADDVSCGRPAPDLIYHAMQQVSQDDPSRVLVVGDTVFDLEAANNANAGYIVGVLTGAHSRSELVRTPHSAILNSVADLPAWVAAHIGADRT